MMGWAGTWLGGFLSTTEPSAESAGSGGCEGDMVKPLVGETSSPMPRPAPGATSQHEERWQVRLTGGCLWAMVLSNQWKGKDARAPWSPPPRQRNGRWPAPPPFTFHHDFFFLESRKATSLELLGKKAFKVTFRQLWRGSSGVD